MFCVLFFFFYCYGAHRDLHVLTHSFPPLRSSDLAVANIAVAYRRRVSERSSGKLAGTNRARKRAPRRRGAPFTKQEPERAGRLLDPVTLHPLALPLAGAADGGGAFARALFAGLFIDRKSTRLNSSHQCA